MKKSFTLTQSKYIVEMHVIKKILKILDPSSEFEFWFFPLSLLVAIKIGSRCLNIIFSTFRKLFYWITNLWRICCQYFEKLCKGECSAPNRFFWGMLNLFSFYNALKLIFYTKTYCLQILSSPVVGWSTGKLSCHFLAQLARITKV